MVVTVTGQCIPNEPDPEVDVLAVGTLSRSRPSDVGHSCAQVSPEYRLRPRVAVVVVGLFLPGAPERIHWDALVRPYGTVLTYERCDR